MIVGVTSDINVRSLGEAPRDVVYETYTQGDGLPAASFVVRTDTDPARMLLALAAAGQEADPDLRVMQSTTMTQHLGDVEVAVADRCRPALGVRGAGHWRWRPSGCTGPCATPWRGAPATSGSVWPRRCSLASERSIQSP